MKKMLMGAVIAIALTTAAFAQVTVGARGIFDFDLGTSAAGDTDDSLALAAQSKQMKDFGTNYKEIPQVGGGFGAFVRYNLPKVKGLGFQGEVDMNFNNAFSMDCKELTVECGYKSIDVPVMVTYDLSAGPVVLTFMAGPNFSFPIGKMALEVGGSSEDYTISSSCLVGITGGVEAAYKVGPGSVAGGVRYVNDFMYTTVTYGGEEMKMFYRRALQVNLGYNYAF